MVDAKRRPVWKQRTYLKLRNRSPWHWMRPRSPPSENGTAPVITGFAIGRTKCGAVVLSGGSLRGVHRSAARRGLGCALVRPGLQFNTVTIRRSLTRTHSRGLFFKEPKNGKARTITMPATLIAILKQHRRRRTKNETSSGPDTRTTISSLPGPMVPSSTLGASGTA